MPNFIEDATDACAGADVSALLLCSADNQDIELWPLNPRSAWTPLKEFNRRQLRIVGAVGLHGMQPKFCFKEALPLSVFEAFGQCFANHVHSLLDANFATRMEISELGRIYAIPDDRLN